MPSFLVLDNFTGQGGTTCAAFQYVNATPTQLGTTFGNNLIPGAKDSACPQNMLVQFQGQLYAMTQDGIWQKDDPTVTTGGWTRVLLFTSPDFGSNTGGAYSGLHPIEVNGVLNLVGFFRTSSIGNGWRWVKFDGTTWTEQSTPTVLAGGAGYAIKSTQVYRGVLYCACRDSANGAIIMSFDPASDSFSLVAGTNVFGGANFVICLCVFDDRLFALGTDWTSFFTELNELVGGTFTTVDFDFDGIGNIGTFMQDTMWALFTDGTYMYGLYGVTAAGANQGWNCMRWDSALTRTDITAEVLPASLIPTSKGGTGFNPNDYRFVPVYDVDTDPANPTIYLYQAPNGIAGTPLTLFRWNYDPVANPPPNPANMISSVDTGGDVQHALPGNEPAGGCRIFTPGELDVKIVSRTGVLGGEEITFRAYGGGTGRNFKLFFQVPGDVAPQEATLAAPVTGGSATFNGAMNRVENIAADGVTDYTVVWNIGADGLTAGTVVDRFPQISV